MDKKIFYHDTDSGGVVYYANYLKYLEEARTELLEDKGLSVKTFEQRGLLYAVSKCNIRYRSPARYGDVLLCGAELIKVTAAQLIFKQNIYNKATNVLIVEAEVTLVCLNTDMKPVQIPQDLKDRMIKA